MGELRGMTSVCECSALCGRESWLAFQVWCVCERACDYTSLLSPLFVSPVCSSTCVATAALQRQKVRSCTDVSQVGWRGESRIMESILLSVS